MRQCMDFENLHRRLAKIAGQVNAIDKMIEEDVPCEDILSQINAAKSALHKCGQIVLEVERLTRGACPVAFVGKYNGAVITPQEILQKVEEA